MKRFKDYSIGMKLSLPILLIVLLISLTSIIISTYYLNKNFKKEILRHLEEKLIVTNDLIQMHSEAALGIASTISEMELVKKAYTEFHKTEDLEKTRNMLVDEFKSISNKLSKESDMQARIHFHVPPAISLLRCWNGTGGDDLSGFRNSILEVVNSQQPAMGIEVGHLGMVIRGLSPIFTFDGEFAGSVEYISPFSEIKEHLISDEVEVAFFILEDLAEDVNFFSNKYEKNKKDQQVKYLITDSNSDTFNIDVVSKHILNNKITEFEIFMENNFYYALSPIYDFSNRIIGLVVYQENVSAYMKTRYSLNLTIIILSVFLTLGGIIFILILIQKVIINPIMIINNISKKLSIGDIQHEISHYNRDEVGLLAATFKKLQRNLLTITNHAKIISSGNYNIEIKPRSNKDELSIALNNMTKSLRKTLKESEIQNWLKTGQNKLNEKMRGNQDVISLSKTVITFLTKKLNAQIGTIFLVNESEKNLVYTGSYALSKGRNVVHKIKFGDGLVGQAALEKKIITISDIPDNYIDINSTFVKLLPKKLLIVPFIFEDSVIGIIELGSINEFTDVDIEFIKSTMENIAIALNSAISREKLNKILENSIKQVEELKNQQEELRVSNEELEEQKEELRATTEKLKNQQEELHAVNIKSKKNTNSLQEESMEN